MLRENEVAVDDDIEDASATDDQIRGRAEIRFELGRQTDGFRLVVSSAAISDRDLHADSNCRNASIVAARRPQSDKFEGREPKTSSAQDGT